MKNWKDGNEDFAAVGNQVWNSKNVKVGATFDGMEVTEVDSNTGIYLRFNDGGGDAFYTWKNFNIYFGSQFVK